MAVDAIALLFAACATAAGAPDSVASSVFTDPTGALQVVNLNSRSNTNGAFFQSLDSAAANSRAV